LGLGRQTGWKKREDFWVCLKEGRGGGIRDREGLRHFSIALLSFKNPK
jgi:hypothetical protein